MVSLQERWRMWRIGECGRHTEGATQKLLMPPQGQRMRTAPDDDSFGIADRVSPRITIASSPERGWMGGGATFQLQDVTNQDDATKSCALFKDDLCQICSLRFS